MQLASLLAEVPNACVDGPTDVVVTGIETDSRRVTPGVLFVAYQGLTHDLHRFIPDAIAAGARAVVVERQVDVPAGIARLVVPSARRAWAQLSAAWHGFPSRHMGVIGVTGTDGKTTTSSLIAAVLTAGGSKVGAVTTVAADVGGEAIETGLHTTTPDPPEIQAFLAEMVRRGVNAAIIETTSHALALEKVVGVDYDVAVVTNVTHEHLDFHGTWDRYLEAKAQLFEMAAASPRKQGRPKAAILNADDPSFERLRKISVERRLTYALDGAADVTAHRVEMAAAGTAFVASTPLGEIQIHTRLLGRFNIANALAAIATGLAMDLSPDTIAEGLARFRGVPGRLETIDHGQPFGVMVDFAHTPNSLRRILELGRMLTNGRVSVVFGSAGLRDTAKRPLMGRIAGELADHVYVTAEDPRTEDLNVIFEQVADGVRAAGNRPHLIANRGDAIDQAIRDARPHDLVIITGKGHEQTLAIGEVEIPWDDRRAARESLVRLGFGEPPR